MTEETPMPANFLWGAATSAHQVEGWNLHSDWWAAETAGSVPVASGAACDHRGRLLGDLDLLAAAGCNAYRFSVEWARLEPEPGRWDDLEMARYVAMARACRERGLTPLVTLYHFTLPQWVAKRGGWLWSGAPGAFAAYSSRVVTALGDLVELYATVNEPVVYALQAHLHGAWPPLGRSALGAFVVAIRLVQAHRAAYAAVHQARPGAQVGVAKHAIHFRPLTPGRRVDALMARAVAYIFNFAWLNALVSELDFIGINYYTTHYCAAGGQHQMPWPQLVRARERVQTEIGWEIHPGGLAHILRAMARYGLPLYVTENGIATDDDGLRQRFIRRHLRAAARAVAAGVPLRGYFHWSLLDNFEWAEGYSAHFGLIGVERATLERDVRPSLGYLGAIARRNAVPRSAEDEPRGSGEAVGD